MVKYGLKQVVLDCSLYVQLFYDFAKISMFLDRFTEPFLFNLLRINGLYTF
jgi:hypothetical protein